MFVLLLPSLSLAGVIVGEDLLCTEKSDTLELIGARTGVSWQKIAKDNDIDTKRGFRSASS